MDHRGEVGGDTATPARDGRRMDGRRKKPQLEVRTVEVGDRGSGIGDRGSGIGRFAMSRRLVFIFVALAVATTAAAQDPISDALRGSWNGAKRNIRESAEQMPEENYNFKPSPDVRTFGQILAHVAGASYVF